MPRKKKTRAQKKISDQRNTESLAVQHLHASPSYVFSAKNISVSSVEKKETGNALTFVQKDLQKTALISVVIVTLQLFFYFLLHNHMLAISFVRY